MHTFIKRYLFDDAKLRDRALLELTRGLRDGRMIALTGSMATEALGYFDWAGARREFADVATALITEVETALGQWATGDQQAKKLVNVIRAHCVLLTTEPKDERKIDGRVHFNVIREAFDALGEIMAMRGCGLAQKSVTNLSEAIELLKAQNLATQTLEEIESVLSDKHANQTLRSVLDERFAKRFEARAMEGSAKASPIRPLIEALGITRLVTLNYDFELERALMLRADERQSIKRDSKRKFRSFVGPSEAPREITLDPIKRLRRTRGDGLSVESDVLNRERVDRLIEFAVGSANVDYHLLHLHGRADDPSSMVVDIRDYDRLYRRDDLFKNPFEYGLRVLFAGNPVLFVGVGMTEAEINATLQDFVSDSPYRRTAPAFLLWNTTAFSEDPEVRSEEKRLRRLDFLQRLGVYVIFDDDFDWKTRPNPDDYRRVISCLKRFEKKDNEPQENVEYFKRTGRTLVLESLCAMVANLHKSVGKIETYGTRVGNGWRNTQERNKALSGRPVRLWGTPRLVKEARDVAFGTDGNVHGSKKEPIRIRFTRIESPARSTRPCKQLMTGMAAPGFGRGLLAEWLVQNANSIFGPWKIGTVAEKNRLLVNAGFSYDSDALLSGIADFLWARNEKSEGPRPCRERFFASGDAFKVAKPALIVINGVDRFFGYDGAPLSAELDHLLRCIIAPGNSGSKVRWLLLGTERLTRYLSSLGLPSYRLENASEKQAAPSDAPGSGVDYSQPPLPNSRYLDHVAKMFWDSGRTLAPAAEAKLSIAKHISRDALRRAFFSAYLAPIMLGQTPSKHPKAPESAVHVPECLEEPLDCALAFEVLRAMAFIGWPVEVGVLVHVPRIAALLPPDGKGKQDLVPLTKTMDQLRGLGLVIEILQFDSTCHTDPSQLPEPDGEVRLTTRFGLHRAMATELRERHGVPLSEAKLSSTFNMSLFAAQPADDYTPEPEFHDELGNLVDRLIGAWKDEIEHGMDPVLLAAVSQQYPGAVADHVDLAELGAAEFVKLCSPRAVSCLRAALAVIRGYYSTSNLLAIDLSDRLASMSRDGALTEHSDRLDRLLKGFGKIATARQTFRNIAAGSKSKAGRNLGDKAQQWLGPEPLYPDDLVWLHNERGVVKLAQGDLYGARRSFSLALRMNEMHVEQDHKGHNWRRITLNMVGVLIERGRLRSAETRLDEVEASINQAAWVRKPDKSEQDPSGDSRFTRILARYGIQNGFIDDCSSAEFTREEILMVGLVTGYRGLIGQNRGHEKTAKGLYERSISILRRLGEQRSYALFQRHYASLRQIAHDDGMMKRQVALAVAAADAAHQMDMSYRARLLRADLSRRMLGNAHERKSVLADIDRALRYAALTDSYRVRIEASTSLARLMLESGEFDAALKNACDAMAVASRFGHSLHKIALRVLIGDILIQRGDPKSGGALLDEALSLAARIGYYRIVERVQRARRSESSLASASNIQSR